MPATQNDDGHVQSAAPVTKTATHLLKTSQKYCACHRKRLSTRYEPRLNVTKCHACHAKRSYATLETSKSDPFCRTYRRHGHTALRRTVADGYGRKRNVERTHPQPPDPESETGTLATHSGKKIRLSLIICLGAMLTTLGTLKRCKFPEHVEESCWSFQGRTCKFSPSHFGVLMLNMTTHMHFSFRNQVGSEVPNWPHHTPQLANVAIILGNWFLGWLAECWTNYRPSKHATAATTHLSVDGLVMFSGSDGAKHGCGPKKNRRFQRRRFIATPEHIVINQQEVGKISMAKAPNVYREDWMDLQRDKVLKTKKMRAATCSQLS